MRIPFSEHPPEQPVAPIAPIASGRETSPGTARAAGKAGTAGTAGAGGADKGLAPVTARQNALTLATEALSGLQQALNAAVFGPEGLLGLQGSAALGAPQLLGDLVNQRCVEYAESGGPALDRDYFVSQARRLAARLEPVVAQHAAQQGRLWRQQTYSNRAAVAVDTALRHGDDPIARDSALAEALQAVTLAAEAAGLGPEAVQRQRMALRSRAALGRALQAVAAGDGATVRAVLDSGQLSPEDAAKVRRVQEHTSRTAAQGAARKAWQEWRRAAQAWETQLCEALEAGDYARARERALAAPATVALAVPADGAQVDPADGALAAPADGARFVPADGAQVALAAGARIPSLQQEAGAPQDYVQAALNLVDAHILGLPPSSDALLVWCWKELLLQDPQQFAASWNPLAYLDSMDRPTRMAFSQAAESLIAGGPEAAARYYAQALQDSRLLQSAYTALGVEDRATASEADIVRLLDFTRSFQAELNAWITKNRRAPSLLEKAQIRDQLVTLCQEAGFQKS